MKWGVCGVMVAFRIKDPAVGDEGLATRDKSLGMRVECLGLGGDATVPEGQQRATLVEDTAVGEPLGLGYRALRRLEIALGEGRMPSVFEDQHELHCYQSHGQGIARN
nr:hypothetical protein [Tanacetum cinerariifolium]